MKKKLFAGLLLLSIFSNIIFAASGEEVENQQKDIVSTSQQIIKDIKRFEIITLGAMPFVTMDYSLAFSTYYSFVKPGEIEQITQPTPFLALTYSSPTDREYSTAEKWENFWGSPCGKVIIGSAVCSVSVGVADLFIRLYKRGVFTKKVKVNNKNIKITDLENDPDATKIILRGKEIDNSENFEIENGFSSKNKEEVKSDSNDIVNSGEE